MVPRELLRPLPFRGDLIAAGAVVLAVGVLLVDTRMQDAWAAGVRFVVVGATAALLLALAWRAPVEGPAPRAYVSAMLAAAFPLSAVALAELADALGGSLDSAGSAFWVLGVLAIGYAVLARARASAVCTLLAVLSAIGAVLALWDWIFSPESVTPFRWLLLAAIVALGLGAIRLRDRERRHAVALLDAAGLAAIAIGALSAAGLIEGAGGSGIGTGWQIVLLAAGFGLVAYAGADREPGPGWIGAFVLLTFVVTAAQEGSLLWWPMLLVVLGGAVVAAGLRPTTPLPPPPDADDPPAPTTPLR